MEHSDFVRDAVLVCQRDLGPFAKRSELFDKEARNRDARGGSGDHTDRILGPARGSKLPQPARPHGAKEQGPHALLAWCDRLLAEREALKAGLASASSGSILPDRDASVPSPDHAVDDRRPKNMRNGLPFNRLACYNPSS